MFASASVTCVCSFVLICVALATPRWMSSRVGFSGGNSSVTVSLTYGLFSGTCEQFVAAGLQVAGTTFRGGWTRLEADGVFAVARATGAAARCVHPCP